MECAACGKKRRTRPYVGRNNHTVIGITECVKCGAVIGTCYRGDAWFIVDLRRLVEDAAEENTILCYFDLTLLGSSGIERVHGWMNSSRQVVQFG